MPIYDASNILWASSPGDCTWSFRTITSVGFPFVTETLAVPSIVNVGDPALIVLISAPYGSGGPVVSLEGVRGLRYVDGLGNPARIPDVTFRADPNNGSLTTPWNVAGFVFAAWNAIGTGGGHIEIDIGSFYLDFTSGLSVTSGNGLAVACIADIGAFGAVGSKIGGDPTGTSELFSTGSDLNPTITTPILSGRGLVLAGASGYSSGDLNLIGNPGWTSLVHDHITTTITANANAGILGSHILPASSLNLAVYDSLLDRTAVWQSDSPGNWEAAGGTLWIPGGGGASRSRVFVIG